MASGTEKALRLLKHLPRVELNNLRPLPQVKISKKARNKWRTGRDKGGKVERRNMVPLGIEGGNTPFYLRIPKEPYYKDFLKRRQLPLTSLLDIQRSVDMGWFDVTQPIDLTTLSDTCGKSVDPKEREFGYNLTEDGVDQFEAKINIEVQHASELAIAAVEKNGGTIVTKFYDIRCVEAMVDPEAFFKKGIPIPVNMIPPRDIIHYYMDPKNRGYLANPAEIDECRFELAQKYGYTLPDLKQDPLYEMLVMRKRPDQIWYGLEPGWVINLSDKTIIQPKSREAKEYYEGEHIYGGTLEDIQATDKTVHRDKYHDEDEGTSV